jgi:hypothetical protein
MITQQAQKSLITRDINVHPKDWLEQFGLETPAIYTFKMQLTGQTLKYELYPDYCMYDGWRWISKDKKKWKENRMVYESL